MPITPVGDALIALKADTDDLLKGMATSKDSIGLLTTSFSQLAATARNTGIIMSAGAALGGAALFALSQRASRVNEKFREIRSITDEVENVQAEYRDLVSDLNTELGLNVSRLDVLEGLYQSISAGVSEAESAQREFLTTAGKLAVVGRVDLATAVDVVSTAMNAYGEGTDFATRASMSLFRTVQFGKVTLEELAPVFGRITALGADMGVQIEELSAAMAVLTRIGFKSRVAATGVRALIRQLMKPSEQMKETLFDMAIANDLFADSMQQGGELARSYAQDIREATEAIERQERALKDAQEAQTNASIKIQEARLMQMAIEQGRVDQVEDVVSANIRQANSIEELDRIIEQHRLQQQKARVQEQKLNRSISEQEEAIANAKEQFENLEGVTGNLDDGIGTLVTSNMGFIEILRELKRVADENNISMANLIPETRGLQAAMALLGDDGQMLKEIFDTMQESTGAAREKIQEFREAGELTAEQARDLESDMKSLDELHQEMVGPVQHLRDAFSKIGEAMTDLGDIFVEDVFDKIVNIAGSIDRAVDRFRNMDEAVRESISEFAVLAVSIGLVLGPLLLLGGQFALIAGALGAGVIPLLATFGLIAAGVTGAVRNLMGSTEETSEALQNMPENALQHLTRGGEESATMLERMKGFFIDIKSFISTLVALSQEHLIPAFADLKDGLVAVFMTTRNELGAFLAEANRGGSILEFFFEGAAAIISVIGEWLSQNDELIAGFVVFIAKLVETFIPALFAAGRAIKAVLIDALAILADFFREELGFGEEASDLEVLSESILTFAQSLSDAIVNLSNFIEDNSEAVAKILLLVGAIRLAVGIVGTAVRVFGAIASAVQPVISNILLWIGATGNLASDLGLAGALALQLFGLLMKHSSTVARIATLVYNFGLRISGLLGSFGSLSSVLSGGTGLGALAAPLGIAAGLLIMIAGAFVAVRDNVLGARTAVSNILSEMKEGVGLFLRLAGVVKEILLTAWEDFASILGQNNTQLQKLSVIGSIVAAVFGFLFGKVVNIMAILIRFIAIIFRVSNVISSLLIPILRMIGHTIAVFVMTWIDIFITALSLLIAIISGDFGAIDQILADFFQRMMERFSGLESIFRDAGRNFIEALAEGMLNAISDVQSAMGRVIGAAAAYLPDSPAKTGPLSTAGTPPMKAGEKISSGVAEGILEGQGDIESSFESAVDIPDPGEFGTNVPMRTPGRGSGMAMGRSIEVAPKAIFFAQGAFQGVADEEIPMMVREEIEGVFDEVVEDLESTGRQDDPRTGSPHLQR